MTSLSPLPLTSTLLASALLCLTARCGVLHAQAPVVSAPQPLASLSPQALAYEALEEAERLKAQGEQRRAILYYERAYRGLQERSILKRIASLSQKIPLSCARQLRHWRALKARCVSGECPEAWRVEEELNATVKRCEVRLDLRFDTSGAPLRTAEPRAVRPQAVKVVIDDELRGELPLSTLMSAGAHTVTLFQGGERCYEGALTLKESQPVQPYQVTQSGGALKLSPALRSPTPKRSRKKPSELRSRRPHRVRSSAPPSAANKLIKASGAPLKGLSPSAAPSPYQPLQLEAALQCQYKRQGERVLYPDCDGASLKSGEQLRLILKSSADVYLYLFLHNDHGELAVLFPAAGVSNQARAGVEYVLPGEGWYELDDQAGVTERLQLIASRTRIEAFERARGLKVSPRLLDQLRQTALRGVVRHGPPATLSERLQEADRVLTTLGGPQVAAVRFTVEHLPER